MSWLTDLAGRAEELLNKVDKSAAVVFNTDDDSHQRHYRGERSAFEQPNTSAKSPQKTNYAPPAAPVKSDVPRTPNSPAVNKQKPVKQKQTTDEKLLEFLNSEEPLRKSVKSSMTTTNAASDVSRDEPQISATNTVAIDNEIGDVVDSVNTTEPIVAPATASEILVLSPVSESASETNSSSASEHAQLNPHSSEFENRLFKNEIVSLNQELTQALQRNKQQNSEIQRLTKEMEQHSLQLSGGDKVIRELQNRETDLKQALGAKDSQLAVLRVRLQEADVEVTRMKEVVEKLNKDNKRILEDHSSSSDLHSQAIHSLQQRLQQTEDVMERERSNFRTTQIESLQRIEKLEAEVKSMAGSVNEAQSKLVDERARNNDLSAQLKSSKQMLETTQAEMVEYKCKAQRILQSKEKLIASLKEVNSGGGNGSLDHINISTVELEELRNERDDLKEELLQANQQIMTLRSEIQEMEIQMQDEVVLMRQRHKEIEQSLQEERENRKEREREILQQKEDIQYERESHNRQKNTLQSRIQDRDLEIEKLRNQLIAKQVNSSSQAELETRLSALTESLIQKQTILEALSTEKSSLVLQLERLEHQTKDQAAYVRRNAPTTVNVSDDNDVRLRVAGFMVENPFDGQMTRKVKRVYNTIDTLSFRLGVFLRRYPIARILIIIYMVMLHLWVLVVLLTYTPEAHLTGYSPNELEPRR